MEPLENINAQQLPEKTRAAQKSIVVILFLLLPPIITYCYFLLTDSLGSAEIVALLLPIFSGIVGLVAGILAIVIVRNYKGLWLVTIVLIGLYGVLVDGIPIARNTYYGTMDRLQERKARQIDAVTTITGCQTAVSSWLLTRYQGFIPSYYYWSQCVFRTIHTESDYQVCVQQAGNRMDYYRHILADDCENGLTSVRAKSLSDCLPLYGGDYFPTPNGFEPCLKKFVIDKSTFSQCLDAINKKYGDSSVNPFSTNRMSVIRDSKNGAVVIERKDQRIIFTSRYLPCYEAYTSTFHDPAVCPSVYINSSNSIYQAATELGKLCHADLNYVSTHPDYFRVNNE